MMPLENPTGLSTEVESKIKSVFARHEIIARVVLYGSRAKGNYKKGSDIDLTIMADKMTIDEFLLLQRELDDLMLPYKIDLSLFTEIDNPSLIEHIERVGLTFYQK
jgi:predicted nucleotidyltransferase